MSPGKGVEEPDGHGIVDPDFPGVAGNAVAGPAASRSGQQRQHETQDKN